MSVRELIYFFFKLMHKEGFKTNQEGPKIRISCLGTWFCVSFIALNTAFLLLNIREHHTYPKYLHIIPV